MKVGRALAAMLISSASLAHATLFSIANLTVSLPGQAKFPSLSNDGHVAWQVATDSDNIDLFLDGVIMTGASAGQFDGLPSLGDRGSLAWQRWYPSSSPLSGQSEVIHDGAKIAGGGAFSVFKPDLNTRVVTRCGASSAG